MTLSDSAEVTSAPAAAVAAAAAAAAEGAGGGFLMIFHSIPVNLLLSSSSAFESVVF